MHTKHPTILLLSKNQSGAKTQRTQAVQNTQHSHSSNQYRLRNSNTQPDRTFYRYENVKANSTHNVQPRLPYTTSYTYTYLYSNLKSNIGTPETPKFCEPSWAYHLHYAQPTLSRSKASKTRLRCTYLSLITYVLYQGPLYHFSPCKDGPELPSITSCGQMLFLYQ